MIVIEPGRKVSGKAIIGREIDRPDILARNGLVICQVQITNNGAVLPVGNISLEIEVAAQDSIPATKTGRDLEILQPVSKTKSILVTAVFGKQVIIKTES